MSEAYLAILHRARAAKDYLTHWSRGVGDLKTVHEEYDDDLQKLRDGIQEARAEIVRGGAADEMNAAVTRMLGYQEELTELELTRESACEANEETHKELLELTMDNLLGELSRIIRPPSLQPLDSERERSVGDAATDAAGEGSTEPPLEARNAAEWFTGPRLGAHTASDSSAGPRPEAHTAGESSTGPLPETRTAGESSTGQRPDTRTTGESTTESHPKTRGVSAHNSPEPEAPNGTAASPPPDEDYQPSLHPESESEDDGAEASPPPSQKRAKRKAAAACDNARKEALAQDPLWRANKRRRMQEAQEAEEQLHEERNGTGQPHPQSGVTTKGSIAFEEVFGDGKAEHRHFIVQYPLKTGRFYILRCEEHGVHFKSMAIKGAAKHLDTELHGWQGRKWDHAIGTLGVEVLGCDALLMKKNNELLRRDIDEGRYKVLNQTKKATVVKKRQSTVAGKPARNGVPSSPAVGRRTPATKKKFEGVADPVGGGLYLGSWGRQGWYAVVLLPRGPAFGDPRFSSTGIPGTLRNTRLLRKVPACYKFRPGDSKLSGWAKGFEDGGPMVEERRFPVIFFDEEEFPGRCSAGWIRAKNLRPYRRADVPHLDAADDYISLRDNLRAAREAAGLRETSEDESSDGSASEDESSDGSASGSESEDEGVGDGDDDKGDEDGDEQGENQRGEASLGSGDRATQPATNGTRPGLWGMREVAPSPSPTYRTWSASVMSPTEENGLPSPRSREASFRSAPEDQGVSPRGGVEQPTGGLEDIREPPGVGSVYDIINLEDGDGRSGSGEASSSSAAGDAMSAESIRRLSQQAVMAMGTSFQPPPPPPRDAVLNIDGTTRYLPRASDGANHVSAQKSAPPPPGSNGDARRQETPHTTPLRPPPRPPRPPPVWKYYQAPTPAVAPAQGSTTPPAQDDSQSGRLPPMNHFESQYRNIAPGPPGYAMPPPPPPFFAQYNPRDGAWRA